MRIPEQNVFHPLDSERKTGRWGGGGCYRETRKKDKNERQEGALGEPAISFEGYPMEQH
jgi:hypothetical protein